MGKATTNFVSPWPMPVRQSAQFPRQGGIHRGFSNCKIEKLFIKKVHSAFGIWFRILFPHQFNADPDLTFHFNADPDPAFHYISIAPLPVLVRCKTKGAAEDVCNELYEEVLYME